MEAHSDWYNRTVKEINLHNDTLGKKDAKKYKLDLLLRITGRVEEFCGICGECQLFQQDITRLMQELSLLLQMPGKEGRKAYSKKVDAIAKHLQKRHKLVTKGYYVGICMAISAGVGTALGAALGNPGIGPGLGVGIGLAVGSYLDKKAKNEGRVL